MSGGFGRKGLAPGAVPAAQASGFGAAIPASPRAAPVGGPTAGLRNQSDDVAAKRLAFLESERERNAAQPENQTYGYSGSQTLKERSLALAYVFWFILGQLSIHRFYLGATQSAITQVCVLFGSFVILFIFPPLGLIGLGAWAIWLFADLFLMPGLHRQHCYQGGSAHQAFA